MSRITGTDAYYLIEAYNAVYAPQEEVELTEEQVWEEVENWVNSLVEEGYDLSEYTWEEMYEVYIEEQGIPTVPRVPSMQQMVQKGRENEKFNTAFGRSAEQLLGKPGQRPATPAAKAAPTPPAKPAATTPPARPPARPAAGTPAARPAATASSKVAPAKPAATSQTGDKAADMATWAKANPKLAAAAAERARTRGTSATTNPLMKDMKSRLPAPAATSTPSPAPEATTSTTSGQTGTATPKPAASPTTPPTGGSAAAGRREQIKARVQSLTPEQRREVTGGVRPRDMTPEQRRAARDKLKSMSPTTSTTAEHTNLFDLVKEYLLGEGYADTEEAAFAIMANMSEEWRESILIDEGLMDVAGKVVGDITNRLTGKKALIDGPQGYIKVGGPSKPGDVRVGGIGPVGTYGKKYTPQSGDRPITSSIRMK